jgi:hypothetical protein
LSFRPTERQRGKQRNQREAIHFPSAVFRQIASR